MSDKKVIRIGILGFGTVGQGTWKQLTENASSLESILGVCLEPVRAAVRDISKTREVEISADQLTTDTQSIVDDPDIDVICELMGGVELARELTLRAFANGKHVVTANKALICEHGQEIFEAAEKANVRYAFEASVAGGIPIIKVLRECLVANEFPLVYGILNGTSNYILTRMEQEGASFDEVLNDARSLGYVEADEALDLDGVDAAHKAVILAYLAHGVWFPIENMPIEGVRRISNEDLQAARDLNCKIKLIAVIRRNFSNNHVSVGVHPALVPMDEIIARTDGVYNGVSITGTAVGTTVLTGRGAGQDPTASSVVGDIVDIVKTITGAAPPPKLLHVTPDQCSPATAREVTGSFYLRLTVDDRPGQLAQVAEALSDQEVSIATVSQALKECRNAASLILTTHETNEHSIALALEKLEKLPGVLEAPVLFRMFDPNGKDNS